MLQSEILASTSGHTAACVFLYSAIRSGLMPITMPMRFIALLPSFVCTRQAAGPHCVEIPLDAIPGAARARRWKRLRGVAERRTSLLNERVESPRQGFHGRLNPLAPSTKKSFLDLRQKIFRPPAPLVAILPQGLMVLLEVGKQGFQGVEFGLDDAQAREERKVGLNLGRCRSVRHGGIIARKGYRSAKFA